MCVYNTHSQLNSKKNVPSMGRMTLSVRRRQLHRRNRLPRQFQPRTVAVEPLTPMSRVPHEVIAGFLRHPCPLRRADLVLTLTFRPLAEVYGAALCVYVADPKVVRRHWANRLTDLADLSVMTYPRR
jgi:hypothetical protein